METSVVDPVVGSDAAPDSSVLWPAILGEAAALLLFAFIGRSAHHDAAHGALLGTLLVAAPFLVGWYLAATALGAYRPHVWHSLRTLAGRTLAAAAAGDIIACGLRSLAERRLMPADFAVVAFFFTAAFLLAWRLLLRAALTRR